jgi:general secretion pathway protein M
MSRASLLRTRWEGLAPREKVLVAGAAAAVAIVLVWMVALGPALATLRTADEQHRALDAQLQRMRALQLQAQAMQSQPKQNRDAALRQLDLSVKQRLGNSARLVVVGDRATVTLSGAQPDALAQWLTQARVSAHALPNEAHLHRNSSGMWEGTLALTLPR